MRHLDAPESNHLNTKLLEEGHVLDVFKIEHDIKENCPLNPNTSGWCGAYIVFSPSIHALLYQL
jgi:hypothetical protein